MSLQPKTCSVCGNERESTSAYCRSCTNAYHRWRKQNPDIAYPMHEFRELVKLNAVFGNTDINRIVGHRRPGRKPQGGAATSTQAHRRVLGPDEHPSECGCWMCEGYDSYEAYAADH